MPPGVAEKTGFFDHSLAILPLNSLEQIRALRDEAVTLRDRVAAGGYEANELAQFWKIVSRAPSVLLIKPDALSKSAGLGENYFSTVVKEQRYPKLHNFLRAISAVIAAADHRLQDIELPSTALRPEWKPNPLRGDPLRATELQQQLIEVIAHLKSSNSLSDVPELDAYWRNTLVALLETTIAILKAPMTEPSLLRRTIGGLKNFAKNAIKTGANQVTGRIAEEAADGLVGVMKNLL